jgi:hypothetical protein
MSEKEKIPRIGSGSLTRASAEFLAVGGRDGTAVEDAKALGDLGWKREELFSLWQTFARFLD